MARQYSDGTTTAWAYSTLATAIAVGGTSAVVAAGHGVRFPTTGPFTVTIANGTDPFASAYDFEIVQASARTTDTITISAAAKAWGVGAYVVHTIAKADLDAFAETSELAAYQALSVIDVKGDLIVGTAADTTGRLAVGSNYQYPVAASGEATGIKWVGAIGAKVYKAAAQSIANITVTAINFDTEVYDSDGFHDNVTNNTRITIPAGLGGKYEVSGSLSWAANATGNRQTRLNKNGILIGLSKMMGVAAENVFVYFSTVVVLAAADYIELAAYQTSGAALNAGGEAPTAEADLWFSAVFLGP